MNKVVLLAGVACLFATNVFAADFNPYVSAKLKYVYSQNKEKIKGVYLGEAFKETGHLNKGVFGGSFAAGVSSPLEYGAVRMELEYAQNADAKKGHGDEKTTIETRAGFVNAYYDFDLNQSVPLTPYVGMGLGWGHFEVKDDEGPLKKNGLAFNVGAGVSYAMSKNLALDTGYRFVRYAPIKKTYKDDEGMLKVRTQSRAHEIYAGLRYSF